MPSVPPQFHRCTSYQSSTHWKDCSGSFYSSGISRRYWSFFSRNSLEQRFRIVTTQCSLHESPNISTMIQSVFSKIILLWPGYSYAELCTFAWPGDRLEITCEDCNANQNSPCTPLYYVWKPVRKQKESKSRNLYYAWDSRFDVAKDDSGVLSKDQRRNSVSLLFILCGIFGKVSVRFRLWIHQCFYYM